MKTALKIPYVLAFLSISMLINACSDESNFTNFENNIQENTVFLSQEKEALLFMLEEEKLARDTYQFLNEKWKFNQSKKWFIFFLSRNGFGYRAGRRCSIGKRFLWDLYCLYRCMSYRGYFARENNRWQQMHFLFYNRK